MKQNLIQLIVAGLLCLVFSSPALGQSQGHAFEYLDGNQVKARINNSSDMFWDLVGEPAYEVPVGSGKNSAYASSIWLGGLDPSGGLHVAAQTYRQPGTDFSVGPHRTTGVYNDGLIYQASFPIQQMITLSSGNAVFVGETEIHLFDPVAVSTTSFQNPNGNVRTRVIEMASGDVLVYGNGLPFSPDPYIILDAASFTGTNSITPAAYTGSASATLLPNGEILFANSFGCTRFDPATSAELATPPMNQLRNRSTTRIRPDGKVFVAGGSTAASGTNGLVSSTELYDPATNTWAAGPAMNAQRLGFPIVELLSGEWMMAGGNATSGNVDHYNPITGTLSLGATINPVFRSSVAQRRSNGDIAIVAEDLSGGGDNFFVYTPGQNAVQSETTFGFLGEGVTLQNGNFFVQQGYGVFREIDPLTLSLVDQPWEKIWKVTQGQIDQFRADQSVGAVAWNSYPDIETWPAHGDISKGEMANQAPFIDVNNDGNYDPLNDGDYPCIKGDQALWWTFNDDAAFHTESGGASFGVQVKAMAYSYDCDGPCPTPWLDHTTFYQYKITNRSSTNYQDVFLGNWMDVDLGNYSDDFIGSDSALGLAFGYNGNVIDAGATGYGANPPAFGTQLLETPNGGGMTNMMYYGNDFSTTGNPEFPDHYYNYLRSMWKDNTPLVSNGSGYGTGTPTNYAFSGDPGFCGTPAFGWNEVNEGNTPFDRRFLQSYGPFDLNAGDEVTFEVAVIWARGNYNDNLGSVCELKNAADSMQAWFNAQPVCNPSVVNRAEPVAIPEVDIYPNPTRNMTYVDFGKPLVKDIRLDVTDALGRMVLSQNMKRGSQSTQFSTSPLADGMYLIRLQDGSTTHTHKLIVRH